MDQMRPRLRLTAVAIAVLFVASAALAQPPAVTMAFTVSMERPTTHYFHVVFRCEGLKGPTQDFKMPAWTPGYYQIMDYARNVLNFRAEDGTGRAARLGEDREEHLAGPDGPATCCHGQLRRVRLHPVRGRELPGRRAGVHLADRRLHVPRRPAPASRDRHDRAVTRAGAGSRPASIRSRGSRTPSSLRTSTSSTTARSSSATRRSCRSRSRGFPTSSSASDLGNARPRRSSSADLKQHRRGGRRRSSARSPTGTTPSSFHRARAAAASST